MALGTVNVPGMTEAEANEKFITREEAESILNKKEKVFIGQIMTFNQVRDDMSLNDGNVTGLSPFLRDGGKVKRIEIFDSEGALGISTIVINDGELNSCCNRCGRVTSINTGEIHLNVTQAMGAPARVVVYGEIVE